MSRQRVAEIVGQAATRAREKLVARGLPPLPHTTPHALRRTYISIALQAKTSTVGDDLVVGVDRRSVGPDPIGVVAEAVMALADAVGLVADQLRLPRARRPPSTRRRSSASCSAAAASSSARVRVRAGERWPSERGAAEVRSRRSSARRSTTLAR